MCAALLLAAAAQAAPADLPGWRGARWGMTEAELEAVFGDALARLPGRWAYGGAYPERALFGVELDGLRSDALFQMNERTERLPAGLLERRSEDRRAGKECDHPGRAGWGPCH